MGTRVWAWHLNKCLKSIIFTHKRTTACSTNRQYSGNNKFSAYSLTATIISWHEATANSYVLPNNSMNTLYS